MEKTKTNSLNRTAKERIELNCEKYFIGICLNVQVCLYLRVTIGTKDKRNATVRMDKHSAGFLRISEYVCV